MTLKYNIDKEELSPTVKKDKEVDKVNLKKAREGGLFNIKLFLQTSKKSFKKLYK